MCDQCTPPTYDEEAGLSRFDVHNAPHPFLKPGVDRQEYYRSVVEQLSVMFGYIAMCPEKSDEWLDGAADFIVNRFGVNDAGDVPASPAALFDDAPAGEDAFAPAIDGLRELLHSLKKKPELAEAWREGRFHMVVDHRGAAWKASDTGLPLNDDDLPGMYL